MPVNVSYEHFLWITYICYYEIFLNFKFHLMGKKENTMGDFDHNTEIFQAVFWIRINGSVHTDSCA